MRISLKRLAGWLHPPTILPKQDFLAVSLSMNTHSILQQEKLKISTDGILEENVQSERFTE